MDAIPVQADQLGRVFDVATSLEYSNLKAPNISVKRECLPAQGTEMVLMPHVEQLADVAELPPTRLRVQTSGASPAPALVSARKYLP